MSFSQEGEDLLVGRILDGRATGFYVDVGAHHPTRYSNTYLLYQRGWSGLNIDATPDSMVAFARRRPRDINIEMAVAEHADSIELHRFDDSALNTASAQIAARRVGEDDHPVVEIVNVKAAPLRSILDSHMPANTPIDLMTIDVEGHDFEVLRSNDWGRYRPAVLVVEVLETTLEELRSRPEIEFLREQGYELHSKLHYSVVLVDTRR